MEIKRIFWLEDQSEDFSAYRSVFFRSGYIVDVVPSVSDAVEKLRQEKAN
jgi:CheY-like chemotaxis protein